MSTTFKSAAESYFRRRGPARGTRNEYASTIRKWERWGGGGPIEQLRRKEVREFLDWVREQAVGDEGTKPGRTANKAREHLRAVLSWAWEQELIKAPPRFPGPREQHRRCRTPLPDQGRDQRSLLRNSHHVATPELGRSLADRPVVASGNVALSRGPGKRGGASISSCSQAQDNTARRCSRALLAVRPGLVPSSPTACSWTQSRNSRTSLRRSCSIGPPPPHRSHLRMVEAYSFRVPRAALGAEIALGGRLEGRGHPSAPVPEVNRPIWHPCYCRWNPDVLIGRRATGIRGIPHERVPTLSTVPPAASCEMTRLGGPTHTR